MLFSSLTSFHPLLIADHDRACSVAFQADDSSETPPKLVITNRDLLLATHLRETLQVCLLTPPQRLCPTLTDAPRTGRSSQTSRSQSRKRRQDASARSCRGLMRSSPLLTSYSSTTSATRLPSTTRSFAVSQHSTVTTPNLMTATTSDARFVSPAVSFESHGLSDQEQLDRGES